MYARLSVYFIRQFVFVRICLKLVSQVYIYIILQSVPQRTRNIIIIIVIIVWRAMDIADGRAPLECSRSETHPSRGHDYIHIYDAKEISEDEV